MQTPAEQIKPRCILWIEDRPETVTEQIYLAEQMGYTVRMAVMPNKIKEVLDQEQEQVVAILMDTMLFGVRNLKSIGIDTAITDEGLEAGWALLEQYIRVEEKSKFAEIPVLVFSARPLDDDHQQRLESLRQRGGEIDFIEKGKLGWQKKFSDWLNRLNNQFGGENTHA